MNQRTNIFVIPSVVEESSEFLLAKKRNSNVISTLGFDFRLDMKDTVAENENPLEVMGAVQ